MRRRTEAKTTSTETFSLAKSGFRLSTTKIGTPDLIFDDDKYSVRVEMVDDHGYRGVPFPALSTRRIDCSNCPREG
jgi:hypothetical protein